jgi:hypothetical protein
VHAPRGSTTDDIANILWRGDALVVSEGGGWKDDTARKLAAHYVKRRLEESADDMALILNMLGLPEVVPDVTDEERDLWGKGLVPSPRELGE